MGTPLPEHTKVFICYSASEKDQVHFDRLKVHLSPLVRSGRIDVWDKNDIKAGANIVKEIEQAINLTCIAVILLSADLIADNDIYQHELIPLCIAAEHQKITLLPVLLSVCNWESMYIKNLKFINSDKVTVESLNNEQREIVWKNTADNISSVLEIISSKTSVSPKTKPAVMPSRYQIILDQLADKELEPQERVKIAYTLIEASEILAPAVQTLIQDNLHSIRIDEPDTQVYDAINLVLVFFNDETAYQRFQPLFLNGSIPPAFRARAAKHVARKIKGTELIALLTGEKGTHHALEAGLDIVHALQYTKRNDLKILLRAALDQHPFTMTVRTAILNALGNTRD